jgi:hypothetical protein
MSPAVLMLLVAPSVAVVTVAVYIWQRNKKK